MISAEESLARLKEGNRRFVSNVDGSSEISAQAKRHELIAGQEPHTIILGCSDSRAPAEIIFDQGIGDLFVIRIAGNIVAPSHIASVEFAAEQFHTQLVVVLGHSNCGAVKATIEDLKQPYNKRSQNLHSIVSRIRPAIEPLLDTELKNDPEALLKVGVRANIRASVNQLRHGSNILEQLTHESGLVIVGAEYSLETGEVDFFDF